MDHITWMIDALQATLTTYGGVAVLVSTFLLGENAALAMFALSAQGYINPVKAIVFVFLGSLLADVFWFFMTEYVLRKYYERRLVTTPRDETHQLLIRLIDKHFFWVLIFIKFLVGMRLFLTIYIVLKNRIPFFKKVVLDAIGTVLFLLVLFPVGWFFGKGVSSVLSVERSATGLLSIVLLVIASGVFAPRFIISIIKRFFKEPELSSEPVKI